MATFHLICHGMMMFHWDPSDPTFITILIPQPPAHEVGLTWVRGDISHANNLFTESGGYDLTLDPHLDKEWMYSPTGPGRAKDVILDARAPQFENLLDIDYGAAAYWLKVPRPKRVVRGQVVTLPGYVPSFYSGNSVLAFAMFPDKIAGMHAFIYDDVSRVAVTKQGEAPVLTEVPDPASLYLYAQETKANPASHLGYFNALADYKIRYMSKAKLDLQRFYSGTPDTYGEADPNHLPEGLEKEDYKSLLEHQFATELRKRRMTENDPGVEVLRDLLEILYNGDPVECLQGWGT